MQESVSGKSPSSTGRSNLVDGIASGGREDHAGKHIPRRTAIVHGSALAAAALAGRGADFALAQQTQEAEPAGQPPRINPNVRRIVTTLDGHGRSHVMLDRTATHGFGPITQVWVTERVPASNSGTTDNAERPIRLEPPSNGVNFFFVKLMPVSASASLSPEQQEKNRAEAFKALGASHTRVDTSRNVGMHKTRTVDYIILLSGEVDLLLDDGEVHLKPFDVVIQRGTNHAWVNRGTEPALLAAVLIDAEPTGT